MSSMISIALALIAAVGERPAKLDSVACVQDTAQQHLLERVVRDEFLLSPDWAPSRERWGWAASPADVAAVTDASLCARASRAIFAAERSRELYKSLVLVRAGNVYVAAPPTSGDEWIFLDLAWRVVGHVVVPS